MIPPSAVERIQILRRIADRGQKSAVEDGYGSAVDCFQHLLNELQVLQKELGVETDLSTEGSY